MVATTVIPVSPSESTYITRGCGLMGFGDMPRPGLRGGWDQRRKHQLMRITVSTASMHNNLSSIDAFQSRNTSFYEPFRHEPSDFDGCRSHSAPARRTAIRSTSRSFFRTCTLATRSFFRWLWTGSAFAKICGEEQAELQVLKNLNSSLRNRVIDSPGTQKRG